MTSSCDEYLDTLARNDELLRLRHCEEPEATKQSGLYAEIARNGKLLQ
ncbi:MAG: hypothetical protein KA436_06345 [Oligoflexales bacterium]|nr:hypothetical protein [Oligoflexales bacterium]